MGCYSSMNKFFKDFGKRTNFGLGRKGFGSNESYFLNKSVTFAIFSSDGKTFSSMQTSITKKVKYFWSQI